MAHSRIPSKQDLTSLTLSEEPASKLTEGLICHYNFETGSVSGSTVTDLTGNYPGSLTGSPTIVDGLYGKALNLNGSSQWLTLNNSTSLLQGATAFTVCAGLNCTAMHGAIPGGNGSSFFAKGLSYAYDLLCAMDNNGNNYLQVNVGADGANGYSDSSVYGRYIVYSMVFDGTQSVNADRIKIYENLNQKSLWLGYTVPAAVSTQGGNAVIGMYPPAGSMIFLGQIEFFRLYNRAMTLEDIMLVNAVNN